MTTDIDKKMVEYVKVNIEVSDSIHKSYWNNDNDVKRAYTSCPCGNDKLQFVEVYLDKDKNIRNDSYISESAWKLYLHIERKIRLNPDKEHIDILIKLIGKDDALMLIERWAKKNIAIGMALMKYIEDMKICVGSTVHAVQRGNK